MEYQNSTYDDLVACIENLAQRLRELSEKHTGVLLRDGAVWLVNGELVSVGEDDEDFSSRHDVSEVDCD